MMACLPHGSLWGLRPCLGSTHPVPGACDFLVVLAAIIVTFTEVPLLD
jgi:hypothetical protein